MKRIKNSVHILAIACSMVFAQKQVHPLTNQTITGPIHTTIQEIQSVVGSRLSVCDDKSVFHTLTVVVSGRMTAPGRIFFEPMSVNGIVYPSTTVSTSVNQFGRELPIQAGSGPFSGIWLRPSPSGPAECNRALTPDDILDALAGDSVRVLGIVDDNSGNGFGGNTQIIPLGFTILGTANNLPPTRNGQQIEGIAPVTVTVAELNTGADNINNLVDGEKYEGMFVELRDLTVVDYSRGTTSQTSIDFTLNQRYRIVCRDAAGNRIQIYDRFKAGRLPNDVTTSSTCGGAEVSRGGRLSQVPIIGGKYDYVRGVLVHIKNQVPGQTCMNVATISSPAGPANDKGYQLEPFHPSHYGIAQYNPPIISDIVVTPQAPKSSESVTISATIQAIDPGISVASASLYFSTDTINFATWSNIAMTNVGNTWSANLSNIAGSFADGKIIYFYIKAADSRTPSAESVFPRVPITIGGILGTAKPAAFVVRDNGLRISDVQKTPFTNGRSLYENRVVTLTGIATSTQSDLGVVTLQEENATEWAAIFLNSSPFLAKVKKGDKITVSGKVVEQNSGSGSTITMLRELSLSANVEIISSNHTIQPLFIDHLLLSGRYDFRKHEKYEAMLAQIAAPSGKLYVIDTNADYKANFSEYRIGTDRTLLASLPETITGTSRDLAFPATRVLAGRAPAFGTSPSALYVISSQVFPLINRPVVLLTSAGSNNLPDTATIKINKVNPIFVGSDVEFDFVSGIITQSFGNMKLLPRDVYDIANLKVNGVPAVLTLPGFGQITNLIPHAEFSEIVIYPNPAKQSFTLHSGRVPVQEVKLLNLFGQLLETHPAESAVVTCSVENLSAGMYLVEVYLTNGQKKTLRFVKE